MANTGCHAFNAFGHACPVLHAVRPSSAVHCTVRTGVSGLVINQLSYGSTVLRWQAARLHGHGRLKWLSIRHWGYVGAVHEVHKRVVCLSGCMLAVALVSVLFGSCCQPHVGYAATRHCPVMANLQQVCRYAGGCEPSCPHVMVRLWAAAVLAPPINNSTGQLCIGWVTAVHGHTLRLQAANRRCFWKAGHLAGLVHVTVGPRLLSVRPPVVLSSRFPSELGQA